MRAQIGYTQKQVADLLGVDRSTYSYYELGKIKPDIKTIMKLSGIFKVHYTEILESEISYQFSDSLSQKNNQNVKLHLDELTPEEYNVLMAFKILPENSKNEVIKIINEKFEKLNRRKNKDAIIDLFKK